MAASIGSRTLKPWQAVIFASIFEFCGAFFFGSTVADTVSTKVADMATFSGRPELYMYGLLCALFCGANWILLATVRPPLASAPGRSSIGIGSLRGSSAACAPTLRYPPVHTQAVESSACALDLNSLGVHL